MPDNQKEIAVAKTARPSRSNATAKNKKAGKATSRFARFWRQGIFARQYGKPLAFVVIFAVLGVGALLITNAASNSVTGPITGIGGKCLDDQYGQLRSQNTVWLYSCNGTPAQQWTMPGDGTIRLGNNQYCLDVQWAGTRSGTPVWLYGCNGTPAQQWVMRNNGAIVNPHSGLCLDDQWGRTGDGNPIWIYSCNGTPAQQWHVPTAVQTTPPPSGNGSSGSGTSGSAPGSQGGGTQPTPPPATAAAPDGVPGNWKLAFDDEFSGSSVDLSKWQFTSSSQTDCGQGNKENGQAEWVPIGSNGQSPNVTEANGLLTLTAKRENTNACGRTFAWTSGRVVTKQAFGANTVIEIREQTNGMNDGSTGTWNGFWTWQAGGPALPGNGEIDGYEFWPPHNNTYNLTDHIGGGGTQYTVANVTQWHTVDIVIGSGGTQWYIDGRQVGSGKGKLGSSTVNVLLDQDVCGTAGTYNPNPCPQPDAGATWSTLNFDYFRAWTAQ